MHFVGFLMQRLFSHMQIVGFLMQRLKLFSHLSVKIRSQRKNSTTSPLDAYIRLGIYSYIFEGGQQTRKHVAKNYCSHFGRPCLCALYLRNRSALAVNCLVIIHCLEVSCKADQITSEKRE